MNHLFHYSKAISHYQTEPKQAQFPNWSGTSKRNGVVEEEIEGYEHKPQSKLGNHKTRTHKEDSKKFVVYFQVAWGIAGGTDQHLSI